LRVANRIRRNEYRDSVILMKASEELQATAGVMQAALMMGTDANKGVLNSAGLLTDEGQQARAGDLIVAIQAVDAQALENALSRVEKALESPTGRPGLGSTRSVDSAIKAMPDANLAVISVPGRFAAREARKALQHGLHVFLFSDNVPLEEEVELKSMAERRGLLVMGPECGTSIINHVGIGFANRIRAGSIGIIAASGTGLQEVSVLIHREGVGISQAIGVGGRDLSHEVGGISTLHALELLDADTETKVIVLLSKLPAPSAMEAVLKRVAKGGKPVVVSFLGRDAWRADQPNARFADNLEEAAMMAVAAVTEDDYQSLSFSVSDAAMDDHVAREVREWAPEQKHIRGLFSGGTLCYEAMWILKDYVGDVWSNIPLRETLRLPDVNTSYCHTLIDMGTDNFTHSRPHPMIDPRLRQDRILREAQDANVAVLLLDVVLGYGSHSDPAGALTGAIAKAKAQATERGGHLTVVASVCGTDQDSQGLTVQEDRLQKAGVIVMPSNAQAARFAGSMAGHYNPRNVLDR